MGRQLSGGFYNIALTAIAVGYVLLLIVLLEADSGGRAAVTPPAGTPSAPPGRGSESQRALDLARDAAPRFGLQSGGKLRSSCTAAGSGFDCAVVGFIPTSGQGACTINVRVDGQTKSAFVRDYRCQ